MDIDVSCHLGFAKEMEAIEKGEFVSGLSTLPLSTSGHTYNTYPHTRMRRTTDFGRDEIQGCNVLVVREEDAVILVIGPDGVDWIFAWGHNAQRGAICGPFSHGAVEVARDERFPVH